MCLFFLLEVRLKGPVPTRSFGGRRKNPSSSSASRFRSSERRCELQKS